MVASTLFTLILIISLFSWLWKKFSEEDKTVVDNKIDKINNITKEYDKIVNFEKNNKDYENKVNKVNTFKQK
jgi:hypothetical protein